MPIQLLEARYGKVVLAAPYLHSALIDIAPQTRWVKSRGTPIIDSLAHIATAFGAARPKIGDVLVLGYPNQRPLFSGRVDFIGPRDSPGLGAGMEIRADDRAQYSARARTRPLLPCRDRPEPRSRSGTQRRFWESATCRPS